MGSLVDSLRGALEQNENIKLLMLCKASKQLEQLSDAFPERVVRLWVPQSKVFETLVAADYALLFREPSIVNKVASPVKFAEYLACGLVPLTNGAVEQVACFVDDNQAGYTGGENELLGNISSRPSYVEKQRMNQLSLSHYQRIKFETEYREGLGINQVSVRDMQ